MRTLGSLSLVLLCACQPVSVTVADKNDAGASPGGANGCGDDDCGHMGGAPAATGGTAGSAVGGSDSGSGNAGESPTGGVSGTSGSGGTDASGGTTASGGTDVSGGTTASGGTDASGGTNASGGSGGVPPPDPYAPRSGRFKMLVYSRTTAFRHSDAISAGTSMLQAIGNERDFEVVASETNEHFTVEGLSEFEIVFFMQTSGDVLNAAEEQAFETWMTERHGAWAGVHGASDAEGGWPFYLELMGQGAVLHDPCCPTGLLDLDPAYATHPAIAGLPNPWSRQEEWKNFDQYQTWSVKPGFQILARQQDDQQPIVWARQYANFRSFYSALGHQASAFSDPAMKQHITGGVLWAVRREHLL